MRYVLGLVLVVSMQLSGLAKEQDAISGPVDTPAKVMQLEKRLVSQNLDRLRISYRARQIFIGTANPKLVSVSSEWVTIRGSEHGGFLMDNTPPTIVPIGDARQVVIVPLRDGGATPASWRDDLFFSLIAGRFRYIGEVHSDSGHLSLTVGNRGYVVVNSPVYSSADPECCPHAWRHASFSVRQEHLVLDRQWVTTR